MAIRVSNLKASERFYELAGAPAEVQLVEAPEPTRLLHIAFGVDAPSAVDEWWQRMTAAGHASDGEPGPRPQYGPTYYGAFVLDPDGNSVEAVHHDHAAAGAVDHLWLRTLDVHAQREHFAPLLRVVHDAPDKVRFRGEEPGSFSFVYGDDPTRNVTFTFDGVDVAL